MSSDLKREKGFTLIEIVLVLAIAGLIMIIVFLALSGAEKNRRDLTRKQDNARLLSQLESYASNNAGNYPTAWSQAGNPFAPSYLPTNWDDPSTGQPYTEGQWSDGTGQLGTCDSSDIGTVFVAINGRAVTTRMCLEQGYQDLTNN